MADYFVPAEWGDDTVEELLARPWRAPGDPSVLGVPTTKARGKVIVSLFASVDRAQDLIYEVGCLPRALEVVVKAGGIGTIEVVNDGSTDAPSWGWRSAEGKLCMTVFPTEPPTLTGILKDANGKPIAHAPVQVNMGQHVLEGFTGPDGSYRFYGASANATVLAKPTFHVAQRPPPRFS